MANAFLLLSIWMLGTLNVISIIAFRPANMVIVVSMVAGILTSVWNHGTTSTLAKWSDRVMISIGALIDGYTIALNMTGRSAQLCSWLLLSSVLTYLLSKAVRNTSLTSISSNVLHAFAHVMITCCHVLMVEFFGISY